MNSDLYYECHVTVDPEFAKKHLELFAKISDMYNFRISSFLMFVDHGEPKAFTTARGTDMTDIQTRMESLCKALKVNGFKVLRYKIEDTLLDSRHQGDTMELL